MTVPLSSVTRQLAIAPVLERAVHKRARWRYATAGEMLATEKRLDMLPEELANTLTMQMGLEKVSPTTTAGVFLRLIILYSYPIMYKSLYIDS